MKIKLSLVIPCLALITFSYNFFKNERLLFVYVLRLLKILITFNKTITFSRITSQMYTNISSRCKTLQYIGRDMYAPQSFFIFAVRHLKLLKTASGVTEVYLPITLILCIVE